MNHHNPWMWSWRFHETHKTQAQQIHSNLTKWSQRTSHKSWRQSWLFCKLTERTTENSYVVQVRPWCNSCTHKKQMYSKNCRKWSQWPLQVRSATAMLCLHPTARQMPCNRAMMTFAYCAHGMWKQQVKQIAKRQLSKKSMCVARAITIEFGWLQWWWPCKMPTATMLADGSGEMSSQNIEHKLNNQPSVAANANKNQVAAHDATTLFDK